MDIAKIYSLVDLTNLNENDLEPEIKALCQRAIENKVAAVCVYPKFVRLASHELKYSNLSIATVGNFPYGINPLTEVISILQTATQKDGAAEVDVVFPYQWYLQGKKQEACDYIAQCKAELDSNVIFKVIIETGAFDDQTILYEASCALLEKGVDFLKTSTGKMAVGATLDAANTLLNAIYDTKSNAGLKVSGGIRTFEQAREYIRLAQDKMGADFINPGRFRIGASRLS